MRWFFVVDRQNYYNVGAMLKLQQREKGNPVPAVAARIYGDKSSFYDCGFVGYQDTLWDVEGRHHFKNCFIEGAVDFIFGNGQSYYEVYININRWFGFFHLISILSNLFYI